jgi:hypothetical protein
MTTRNDARYIESSDTNACLRGWYQGIMDMGGWSDFDEAAFKAAMLDRLTHDLGPEPAEPIVESDFEVEEVTH